MYPHHSAQDVLRCHLCETTVPQYHCGLCHFDLCKACAGAHLLDESREHKIVPIKQRQSPSPEYPKCSKHPARQCELFCEPYDFPICVQCVSSKEHKGHEIIDILIKVKNKKKELKNDIQELETSLHSKYQKAVLEIGIKKSKVKENSKKLQKALHSQKDIWYKEIDTNVQNLQSEIDGSESKLLDGLLKEELKLNHKITVIAGQIVEVKKILDSNNASVVSKYKSKISEIRKLPPRIVVTFPKFLSEKFNTGELRRQFGSLSKFSIATEEPISSIELPGAASFPRKKTLLEKPKVLLDLQIDFDSLYSVQCKNDNEIWTSGEDKIIKLYNLHGELLESVATKDGNYPWDIAVTQNRELVYSYQKNGTVNIFRNGRVKELIRVSGWNARNICITSNGDLLVFMNKYARKQSKVVRYSGNIEVLNIQCDSRGQPLFSGKNTTRLTENKNLDICVADNAAGAVVVVNADGKLRFRYTGVPKEEFFPTGITTDSQAQILIADYHDDRIHIVVQEGQFLRSISNCGFVHPLDLCIDSKDNLFVVSDEDRSVKCIQYCK